jgi:hypothetical protein
VPPIQLCSNKGLSFLIAAVARFLVTELDALVALPRNLETELKERTISLRKRLSQTLLLVLALHLLSL